MSSGELQIGVCVDMGEEGSRELRVESRRVEEDGRQQKKRPPSQTQREWGTQQKLSGIYLARERRVRYPPNCQTKDLLDQAEKPGTAAAIAS